MKILEIIERWWYRDQPVAYAIKHGKGKAGMVLFDDEIMNKNEKNKTKKRRTNN